MELEVVEADFPSVSVKDGSEGDIITHHDELHKSKQTRTFYFVKYRYYEDPKLKSKFEKVEKEIKINNQALLQISEAITLKEWKRYELNWQLGDLQEDRMGYRNILDEERNRICRLHQALVKFRNMTYTSREKEVDLCSSVEELNLLIRRLHFQTQSCRNTLAEEKQLLKAIQQLEGTRQNVIANTPQEQKLFWRPGRYRDTYKYSWKQDHRNRIYDPMDLDGVRKQEQLISDKIKHLMEKVEAMDNEISSLQVKSKGINRRNNAAYGASLELKKQRDEENADYYKNSSLLNNARELAARKNVAALEELSCSEVEKFMSLWSSSKAFRDDYVNRISPSLDSRQLSRDGRMMNPGEKPIVSEFPFASESQTERKEKLTDKAGAKAILQTHNSPRKKPREHEKRLRKKRLTLTPATNVEEQPESDAGVVIKSPIPSVSNEKKENIIRSGNRLKGQNLVPEPVIKRKNSTWHHWLWPAIVALVVALLLALGYYYVL